MPSIQLDIAVVVQEQLQSLVAVKMLRYIKEWVSFYLV